jgi:aminoglycoside phosphotransferase (APT) family kinase protein
MHADEVDVDADLVRRLVDRQFPRWRGLPLEEVDSAGTDNAVFRLGTTKVLRLPRTPGAVGALEKEQRWLPVLAPHLPVRVPTPLAAGTPTAGYPLRWAVYEWLDGDVATHGTVADLDAFATDVAAFLLALRAVDLPDEAARASLRTYRGEPLALRDAATRAAIAESAGLLDVDLATAVWRDALRLPPYDGPPTWLHGDMKPDNLLVHDGRLTGVIDFGVLAVGDPTVDQIVGWNFLTGEARSTFRRRLGADDVTWRRGRAWALTIGLVALPYYRHTNPRLAAVSSHQIAQVLADYEANG